MPRELRLSRVDFAKTRSFRRIQGAFFSYSYGVIPGRTTKGGACVVSKKVARRAVDRNRIRRQVRGPLIFVLSTLPSPLVIICQSKKGVLTARSAEINAEIASLSHKIV